MIKILTILGCTDKDKILSEYNKIEIKIVDFSKNLYGNGNVSNLIIKELLAYEDKGRK